jgi:hypothetical protein
MEKESAALTGVSVSEAHSSRAFKERFGLAPRDPRAVARQRGVDMLPPRASGIAPAAVRSLDR